MSDHSYNPDTKAAREANSRRARCEVAGPLLRRAIEPVRLAVEKQQERTGGLVLLSLSAEEAGQVLAACERADRGIASLAEPAQ